MIYNFWKWQVYKTISLSLISKWLIKIRSSIDNSSNDKLIESESYLKRIAVNLSKTALTMPCLSIIAVFTRSYRVLSSTLLIRKTAVKEVRRLGRSTKLKTSGFVAAGNVSDVFKTCRIYEWCALKDFLFCV